MTTNESPTADNDVPADPATAADQATDGSDSEAGPDEPQDRNSTTGTTSNEASVGRVSGDETGDTDQSGGERKAGRPQDAREGALRKE